MKKSPSALQLKNMIKQSLQRMNTSSPPSPCFKQQLPSTNSSAYKYKARSKTIVISDFIIDEQAELGLSQNKEEYQENEYLRYSVKTNQLTVQCGKITRNDPEFAEYMKQEVAKLVDKYRQKQNIKRKIRGVLGQVSLNKTNSY